jgi:toxin FitB
LNTCSRFLRETAGSESSELNSSYAMSNSDLMYLIDTMVFSELYKPRRHPRFLLWLEEKREDLLFLSTITIGEIERGIETQRSRDPPFAEALVNWLNRSLDVYNDRILPVTTAIARRWGQLSAQIGHTGADLLIAATALEHGLTVATRNVRHFAPTGVAVENPFEDRRGAG